jgi:hypothetical protein
MSFLQQIATSQMRFARKRKRGLTIQSEPAIDEFRSWAGEVRISVLMAANELVIQAGSAFFIPLGKKFDYK